jgi:signal peptidase II
MVGIIVSIALMLVGVGLDQLTKYLVVANMELHESVEVIPGIFNFTYIQNDGAAFGMLDDQRWIFLVLSTIAIIGIVGYLFWKKPQDKLLLASLILIVSGGIGNMIDRIALGYVIDFIDFCAFPEIWKWVFNVADSFVCIGAGIMILWLILDMIKDYKKEQAAKAVCEDAKDDE